MTDCNWPIGEPIETDRKNLTGFVLFVGHTGYASGYVEDENGIKYARKWTPEGISQDTGNLIPPKRKPRAVDVWVDWEGGSEPVCSEMPPMTQGGWHKHTIAHPDDIPPPITRDELLRIIAPYFKIDADGPANLDSRGMVEALYSALIESRQ